MKLLVVHLLAGALLFAQSPSTEKLSADSPRKTASGNTFTAPNGWSLESGASLVVLHTPEQDSHIALFDSNAATAPEAVKAAWAAFQPDFQRPPKLVTPRPGRNGWEERQIFNYETSPNERLAVQAIAQRYGKQWTVVLLYGKEQTFEKRGAQFGLTLGSLRPGGYAKESFAGRKAMSLNAERIEQMKSFVEASMKKLGIPGVGLAFIDGGKVVYEGGIGVKELGKPAPVDANTLFMAASNTKGMSTLLLAMLADEKKLKWDQPVTEIYPSFKLGDDATTKQVLVRHLVCACTGLPRQDLEWIFEFRNATPASSIALLGTMQPTSKFGEVFQYSNLMAAAAGYIGGHLYEPKKELGAAYDDSMQKKVFGPLGMNSTTFDYKRALSGNHATPHSDDWSGEPKVASMAFNYSIMPHRPAGGVWTSAHDLIRYVQLELNKGKLPDGKQLVSEENLLMRRKPQILVGENRDYGMGLFVDQTWGVPVVNHGGSMGGFKSDLMLLPEHGIGAVILTNADNGQRLLRPFLRRLLEVVFDGRPEAVGDVDASVVAYKAAIAKERERLVIPAAADVAGKLAARYKSKELGDLAIRHDGSRTIFDVGEWQTAVASRKNDDGTLSFIATDPILRGFEWVVTERGGKRALIVRDGQHEYVFNES